MYILVWLVSESDHCIASIMLYQLSRNIIAIRTLHDKVQFVNITNN